MPMFCLEFTDKDIQQLIAVSYKIDYLNSAIDTNNDKSKGLYNSLIRNKNT